MVQRGLHWRGRQGGTASFARKLLKMVALWQVLGLRRGFSVSLRPLLSREEHVTEQEKPGLTQRSGRQAIGFANAIGVLLSIHRTMPMQLGVTYLSVAEEQGLTVSALAARCGVDTTVMSRHLRDLGSVNRHQKQGLGLVTTVQEIHADRRERRVYLTERGHAVLRLMIEELKHPYWRIRPDQYLREPKEGP
jgi:DNA-binding MarR family transcriptional regulator